MNKSNDKIIEEFREKFLLKGSDCTWQVFPIPEEIEEFILQALEQKEREVREKALNDFFQAVDARYKDFEITQAMGKILQKLKQPKE